MPVTHVDDTCTVLTIRYNKYGFLINDTIPNPQDIENLIIKVRSWSQSAIVNFIVTAINLHLDSAALRSYVLTTYVLRIGTGKL